LKIKRDKEHFHHLLLYCFDSKKQLPKVTDSETYFESAPSVKSIDFNSVSIGEY